jgi:hypothetical protein
MADSTSQQLTYYYDTYRDKETIFTTEVVQTLNLDPRQIFVKIATTQWPCIINSATLVQAKIIIGAKSGALPMLRQEKGTVALRFCFSQPGGYPISFFISAKITGIAPYADSEELVLITLAFTQRPPDDFIEILGQYSDAGCCWEQKKKRTNTDFAGCPSPAWAEHG